MKKIVKNLLYLYIVFNNTVLLSGCGNASKIERDAENCKSIQYEANIANSENINKEDISLKTKENRLIDSINQMVTVKSVSVEISENEVKIYIQTGDITRLSENQQVDIKDLVRRFVSNTTDITLNVNE